MVDGLATACGYVQPRTDDEWHMCTRQILVEAAELIEASLSTVRQIESSGVPRYDPDAVAEESWTGTMTRPSLTESLKSFVQT